VLGACRVRYLRCPVDHLPTIPELQLLVPHSNTASRGPQPAPARNVSNARDTLSTTVASRRKERTALWQDSSFFQDSFFAPDSRLDSLGGSDLMPLSSAQAAARASAAEPSEPPTGSSDDIAGVVVDTPRYGSTTRH
jgi:hypothetical protein